MSPRQIYPSTITLISAAMHFLVDGLCLCTLYLMSPSFEAWNQTGIFITYNILAFLTQPFTGHLADRTHQKHWMLLVAILLLTAGVAAASATLHLWHPDAAFGMLPTAILLGTGNSFFHTWGGKQVAMKTHNDIRALGVFVSTGAFGLAIGAVFCSWALLFAFLLVLSLLAMVYLAIDFKHDDLSQDTKRITGTTTTYGNDKGHYSKTVTIGAIVILMLLVMLRQPHPRHWCHRHAGKDGRRMDKPMDGHREGHGGSARGNIGMPVLPKCPFCYSTDGTLCHQLYHARDALSG